ncbi:hypothetical protein B0H10DRAFT_2426977 [Mycena sp. CBHHK59/15]|nr:hypothetical protein B0H10DRAFT_2426977 [Mycena sp. CBHHK59/15]
MQTILNIRSTSVAFKKKKSKPVIEDLFDDEEEWDIVKDLIPLGPKSTATAATASVTAATHANACTKSTVFVRFVRPRIGWYATE